MISILSSFPLLLLRCSPALTRKSHLLYTTKRTGPDSYSNLGRLYEKKCQKVLAEHFKTTVNLVGGAGDGGIDLTWTLKNRPINFIGQCKLKHFDKKVESQVCRGLEGSLSACPPGTIGCLISNVRPSSECLDRIKSSVYPIMYVNISEDASCKIIKEVLINNRIKMLYPFFTTKRIRAILGSSYFTFNYE